MCNIMYNKCCLSFLSVEDKSLYFYKNSDSYYENLQDYFVQTILIVKKLDALSGITKLFLFIL